MWEYICMIELGIDIQKKLNQWRHDYDLETLLMSVDHETSYVTLLIRRKKIEL